MIIGISGKKTVGKDTVGKIIQYLTSESNVYPFDLKLDYSYRSNWKQVAFADKLKDIICILIGCTREQLEDESFKSKELGEEWWYFKGRNGSLIPYSEDSKRNDEDLIKPTPRFLLQFIGTNLFRNQLHPEIWVNSLMGEYKYSDINTVQSIRKHYKLGLKESKEIFLSGIYNPNLNTYPNWIITDTRFPNELEAVKKRGGITIRVNRPCNICGGSGYHKMSCPVSKSGEHYSEIALDSAAFDFVINNNKDIEHLVKEVKKILKKLNII